MLPRFSILDVGIKKEHVIVDLLSIYIYVPLRVYWRWRLPGFRYSDLWVLFEITLNNATIWSGLAVSLENFQRSYFLLPWIIYWENIYSWFEYSWHICKLYASLIRNLSVTKHMRLINELNFVKIGVHGLGVESVFSYIVDPGNFPTYIEAISVQLSIHYCDKQNLRWALIIPISWNSCPWVTDTPWV